MKKFKMFLAITAALCLAFGLTGCGLSEGGGVNMPLPDLPEKGYSEEGLYFSLNSDGRSYAVAQGNWSGANLVIPSLFNGAPVTVIWDHAFWGCDRLTKITIPDSVTSIGYGAFGNTAYYNTVDNWTDDVLYIGKHLIEAKRTISGSYTVRNATKTIGDWAFYDCSGLTKITIPDSVTSIGNRAFENCSGLTEITIPDSVTSIEYGAFQGTAYYNTESNWTDDVLYIGNHLIEAKATIFERYTVRKGTKTIGASAFENCSGLTEITIPNSVTSIGSNAFCYCHKLAEITIPDSVTSIESGVFSGCTGLTKVTIPESVVLIERFAFTGCDALTNITVAEGNPVYHSAGNCLIETERKVLIFGCKASVIPDDGSVTSIGGYAFFECEGLTKISIPDSVTSIGSNAFCYCHKLTEITIPDSVTSIESGVFSGCTGLTEITIPVSVTSIGNMAFYGCYGLTEITIPDSVTSIGSNAFGYCQKLTEITIPNSVILIGNSVFDRVRDMTAKSKILSKQPLSRA